MEIAVWVLIILIVINLVLSRKLKESQKEYFYRKGFEDGMQCRLELHINLMNRLHIKEFYDEAMLFKDKDFQEHYNKLSLVASAGFKIAEYFDESLKQDYGLDTIDLNKWMNDITINTEKGI